MKNKDRITYHGRRFRSVSNSGSGEVDSHTLFEYRQEGNVIWATYSGGSISMGTLVGKVNSDDSLEFVYQHLNTDNEFMTGRCNSMPQLLVDGRLRLLERWQWTSGDRSTGESIIEEIRR